MVTTSKLAAVALFVVAVASPHGGETETHGSGSAAMDMGSMLPSGATGTTSSTGDAGMPMDMGSADNTSDMPESSSPESDSMDMEPSPMSMQMHHGRPVLNDPDLEPQQRKYWEMYNTSTYFNSEQGDSSALYAHAVLTVLAWGILYPLTVFISGEPRAQWIYIPFQTVQSVVAVTALLVLGIYSTSAPDLYPNNAYSKFSWLLLFAVIAHWGAMVLRAITCYVTQPDSQNSDVVGDYMLSDLGRGSADLGHGSSTEFESEEDEGMQLGENHDDLTLNMDPSSNLDFEDQLEYGRHHRRHLTTPRPSSLVKKLAKNTLVLRCASAVGGLANVVFNSLNYPLFFMGVCAILMGAATGFCMGQGHKVFSLLAHFIKGFVFFLLGFIELARYFGALARFGMAWNAIDIQSKATAGLYPKFAAPQPSNRFVRWLKFWPENATFEYWQSFLIWFYGITNVFLEHLGNKDGKWTHKDLQHASIAFMFIGGGASGMVLESSTVRRCMSRAFGFEDDESKRRSVRSFSLNPMPALTVFWTGALMSRHQQETELSTAIHVQWGTLLSLAAVMRFGTLAMLTLKHHPKDSFPPQRPFTELLTSFCLICGGLIFMLSQRETTEAMVYRGLDSMFMLNVCVGVSTLLMAYATLVMVLRGLVIRY